MSKPVFEDLFSLSVRRNRKSYLLYQMTWWTTVLVALRICNLLPVPLMILAGLMICGILVCSKIAVTIQRANDISVPQVIWLAIFLPFIGQILEFVLCVMPGDNGSNRFGTDPIL
jgi:uncharacterized membrane protein YhaH (DUF805 family)